MSNGYEYSISKIISRTLVLKISFIFFYELNKCLDFFDPKFIIQNNKVFDAFV